MYQPTFSMFDSVRSDIWAIRESTLQSIVDYCGAMAGFRPPAQQQMKEEDRPRGGVAVIPVAGIIMQKSGSSIMDMLFGGTSTEAISLQFQAALASDEVKSILLEVNSPGGTVYGVAELADEIYAARGKKPIVAAINSLGASAAYWIASAAEEVVVTPSGEVGSIGVYATHQDVSAALEQEGIKVTLISAGKYKTEGNPYEELKEPARAAIQERVDYSYQMFAGGVARNRGVGLDAVMDGYGEGRVLKAEDALAEGLVDQIEPFMNTLRRLLTIGNNNDTVPARRGYSVAHAGYELDLF